MTSRVADHGLSAHITSILCWTFLPSLFTNLLLSTFYRFSPASRPTLPPNASPPQVASANSTAQRHFRRARITLVVAYLAYSILAVYWSQSSIVHQNYFSLVGLSRDVVESQGAQSVKSRWRRLAVLYHPDKVGKGGEQRFVELRRAVDVLGNDNKRWAYERFGPSIFDSGRNLVTHREFLVKGATNAGAFWVFALLSVVGIGCFRTDERRNNFWRYLSLALSVTLEFHLLLRPSPSPTFSFFFPRRVTYEHVALLRQVFISVSMAMSQLSPLLFPAALPLPLPLELATPSPLDDEQSRTRRALELALEDAERLKPLLSRLAQLTTAAELEATGLQHLELRPLVVVSEYRSTTKREEEEEEEEEEVEMEERKRRVVRGVKEQMRKTFEDLQLKSNPATSKVWEEAVKKGRIRKEASRAKNVDEGEVESRKEEEEDESEGSKASEPFISMPSPPTSPLIERRKLDDEVEEVSEREGDPNFSRSLAHLPSPPPEDERAPSK